jgi:MurNAc alpha-1-phosphate uridylyltransferase
VLPVVVLAGGLGTRLRAVTGETLPKALVPVDGRPFIDYKLAGLAHDGITDVVLLVGSKADQLRAHVGDGSRYGMRVRAIDDGPNLRGTGGAILSALPELPDAFWVTYADTYLQADVAAAEERFRDANAIGLMTVLHNRDRWEPSNAVVEDSFVVAYAKGMSDDRAEHIDYGMVALHRAAFRDAPSDAAFDLGVIFNALAPEHQLVAFEVTERFHDIGTPAALAETEEYFRMNDTWTRLGGSG